MGPLILSIPIPKSPPPGYIKLLSNWQKKKKKKKKKKKREREREKKLKKFYRIVKKTRQDRSKEIYNPFCDGATKKLLQLNQNRYEAEF